MKNKEKTLQRIVICGSMSFYSKMLELKSSLAVAGINTVIPKPDNELTHTMQEADFQYVKRIASMKYIRKVRDKKTFGILVCNYDKHGIADYIGANTFAEIAVALAHYKRIYLYQGIPDIYRDELTAWNAICLNGNLTRIVEDCKKAEIIMNSQLTFF